VNTPALISLHQAAVAFGPVQALHACNLQLNRGERLALVGANGSGKTTLLRLLHGLAPHSGRREVHADEHSGVRAGVRADMRSDVRSPPGARAPVVAMVFQRPFVLSLSVRFNLHVGLWLHGVPRTERAQRCDQALVRMGLQDLASRDARTLSGGQLQRLALARAWALQPDVLLLDEPTASLDPGAKREVEQLIEDLASNADGTGGVTLAFSTHNLGQAKRLATRVAYLEAGRVVVDLPVQPFFNGPLPTAAALFLKGELPWTQGQGD
jgi:tungstate transport system ATP-binding protein